MRAASVVFGIVVAVAVTAACAGSEGPARRARPLVGVSLLTQTHAFYKDLEGAMRTEAGVQQIDLAIVSCEMDPAKQAAQLEDFITQRMDAIVVAPCDSAAVVPYINRASEAGIPVFTVDIAARGGRVVSHIASDNEAGGKLAGQTLAKLVGGRGEVVIIDHPEVASVQDRTKGFEEALKAFPDIIVAQRLSAGGQRARAMAVMEDMLQAHPRMRGVFAINDDSALGALAAIEAARRQDIVIVGFDATDEARAVIAAGRGLKADVAQHPKQMGEAAIRAVREVLSGRTVPPSNLIPVSVVDQTTATTPGEGVR